MGHIVKIKFQLCHKGLHWSLMESGHWPCNFTLHCMIMMTLKYCLLILMVCSPKCLGNNANNFLSLAKYFAFAWKNNAYKGTCWYAQQWPKSKSGQFHSSIQNIWILSKIRLGVSWMYRIFSDSKSCAIVSFWWPPTRYFLQFLIFFLFFPSVISLDCFFFFFGGSFEFPLLFIFWWLFSLLGDFLLPQDCNALMWVYLNIF